MSRKTMVLVHFHWVFEVSSICGDVFLSFSIIFHTFSLLFPIFFETFLSFPGVSRNQPGRPSYLKWAKRWGLRGRENRWIFWSSKSKGFDIISETYYIPFFFVFLLYDVSYLWACDSMLRSLLLLIWRVFWVYGRVAPGFCPPSPSTIALGKCVPGAVLPRADFCKIIEAAVL